MRLPFAPIAAVVFAPIVFNPRPRLALRVQSNAPPNSLVLMTFFAKSRSLTNSFFKTASATLGRALSTVTCAQLSLLLLQLLPGSCSRRLS